MHTCSVLGLKPTGVNACCQPRTPRWTTIIRKYLVKSSARKCHLAPKKQSVRCHCIARRCQGDANSSERHQNTAAVGTRPRISLGQLQGGRVARKTVRRHWCRFELPIQNKWDARDTCDLWLGRGERGRRNSETCACISGISHNTSLLIVRLEDRRTNTTQQLECRRTFTAVILLRFSSRSRLSHLQDKSCNQTSGLDSSRVAEALVPPGVLLFPPTPSTHPAIGAPPYTSATLPTSHEESRQNAAIPYALL